ncbi:unnamed protein product [Ilex paraguariensis]|uniref:DUF4283 domain-containing protein n=1 Tax=Ilex paraguariensis TaxID=185542 RepID=A0ABC8SIF8_9AQUA
MDARALIVEVTLERASIVEVTLERASMMVVLALWRGQGGIMEEGLLNKLQSFSLTEEEDVAIDFNTEDIAEGLEECVLSVYVKILSEKYVNTVALKNTMSGVWGCKDLGVMRISSNIFQFFSKEEREIYKILFQGPWCFDNSLIISYRWFKGIGVKSVPFDLVQFWVHVNGLPRECITKDMAIKVADSFKEWEVVEIRE